MWKKRIAYAACGLILVLAGLNEFIHVTPSGDGIVFFWLSRAFHRSEVSRVRLYSQDASDWSESEKEEILGHLTFSIESSVEAEAVLREIMNKRENVTEESVKHMVTAMDRAASEAVLVSDQALGRVHPELPIHFRENYQPGLSAMLKGLADRDEREFARGAELYGEFRNWWKANRSSLKIPSEVNESSPRLTQE